MDNKNNDVIMLNRQIRELRSRIATLEAERDVYKSCCDRMVGTMVMMATDYNDVLNNRKNPETASLKKRAIELMKETCVKDLPIPINDALWNSLRKELGYDQKDEEFGELTVKMLIDKIPHLLSCEGFGVGKAKRLCKALKAYGISPNPWERDLLAHGVNCD